MDQMVRRVVVVVGLLLLVPAVILALLPVSISVPVSFLSDSSLSVSCNPQSFANASHDPSITGGTSYVPAIVVWIEPSTVIPGGVPLSQDPSEAGALCATAAQNQLIPAFVLGGLGLFLLLFGGVILRYIRTGNTSRPDPIVYAGQSKPSGWYPSPGDDSLLRWWDGQHWTAETLNRQQQKGLSAAPSDFRDSRPKG
jgi:hypothetical protein